MKLLGKSLYDMFK